MFKPILAYHIKKTHLTSVAIDTYLQYYVFYLLYIKMFTITKEKIGCMKVSRVIVTKPFVKCIIKVKKSPCLHGVHELAHLLWRQIHVSHQLKRQHR